MQNVVKVFDRMNRSLNYFVHHFWQDDVVAPQLVYEWAARNQLMLQLVGDVIILLSL